MQQRNERYIMKDTQTELVMAKNNTRPKSNNNLNN